MDAQATGIVRRSDEVIVQSRRGDVHCRHLVTCAGLHADRVTKLTGETPAAKIVPFRGEYYKLTPEAAAPRAEPHLSRARIPSSRSSASTSRE